MQKAKSAPFLRQCPCGKVRASKYALKTMNAKRREAFEAKIANCDCAKAKENT